MVSSTTTLTCGKIYFVIVRDRTYPIPEFIDMGFECNTSNLVTMPIGQHQCSRQGCVRVFRRENVPLKQYLYVAHFHSIYGVSIIRGIQGLLYRFKCRNDNFVHGFQTFLTVIIPEFLPPVQLISKSRCIANWLWCPCLRCPWSIEAESSNPDLATLCRELQQLHHSVMTNLI